MSEQTEMPLPIQEKMDITTGYLVMSAVKKLSYKEANCQPKITQPFNMRQKSTTLRIKML